MVPLGSLYVVYSAGTYHISKAGRCHENGTCFLRCEFTKHFQGTGCIYTFRTDQQKIQTIRLRIGDTKRYSLNENGIWNVSVYDWEENLKWSSVPPAISFLIEVKKSSGNHFTIINYVCFTLLFHFSVHDSGIGELCLRSVHNFCVLTCFY